MALFSIREDASLKKYDIDFNLTTNGSHHLPLPYNASMIYYLAKVPLDDEIYAPASIIVMLLVFILMVLVLMLFCLLTNPVPAPNDLGKKKVVSKPPKLIKKDHLQIDWSRLKVSEEKLENLSKIEICKLSEQPTVSAHEGKNLKDAVSAARGPKSSAKSKTSNAQ